jgi:hypothetical protein
VKALLVGVVAAVVTVGVVAVDLVILVREYQRGYFYE